MSEVSKQRLDIALIERGLVESRGKAKGLILSGKVYVSGRQIDKAGTMVSTDELINIKEDPNEFVSRGGLKLQKALEAFKPPVKDRTFIDVGASTGGFTHCLLKEGAKKVYAIDVGYGQLAWKLRQDPRVIVMERTNIRNVDSSCFQVPIEGATIDVAFISLKLVLPVVKELLVSNSHIIALVKPQFEAGRGNVGKKGVVRSPKVHKKVLWDIINFSRDIGLIPLDMTFSPIKGPKGNIEFLLHLLYCGSKEIAKDGDGPTGGMKIRDEIEEIVDRAHLELMP